MGLYELLFGSKKSKAAPGGGKRPSTPLAFQRALTERRFRGSAGHISKAEAQTILGLVQPYLRRVPAGGRLSPSTRRAIAGKLYRLHRDGELSEADYRAAKRLVNEF